jgi:aldehyde dehydrogenase (NAD+)
MMIYRNFINGEWVPSRSAETRPNLNPANTDDVIGQAPFSTREEARAAIASAEAARTQWRQPPAPVRGRIVARVARLMEAAHEELARLLTREEGKTLSESRGEITRSINILDFTAGEGRRLGGELLPLELPNNFAYTRRQPVGVVAIITPWNFPVAIPVWKLAPALVAGNTVVFKPSPLTPGTATRLVELFAEAGLPPGALNLVLGAGRPVGEELVNNPLVKAISFTGSTAVGSQIYAQAAQRGAKAQCEMGGKNAVVVLEDADLTLAAASTVQGAFGSTGQRCSATSRAVVIDTIADEFVERLVSLASKLRVGPGDDPETQVGPSVDQSRYEAVLKYIESGKEDGAELVYGGQPLKEGRLAKGYFIQPTIFDYVEPNMRIAQEEIFGPVLSVLRVKDFDEAVAVANDVPYGLTSSIFSASANKIFQFIDRIEAGVTHVNSPTTGGEAQVPFGGLKASGTGHPELGSTALDFYTELKVVYMDYSGQKRTTQSY